MTMTPYEVVGLTPAEYAALVAALGRTPNLLELGLVGALWSEHCSYKSSKATLTWLKPPPGTVVQGLGENAGVVELVPGWEVAFKVESHNHPSYVEPFQGAATGVGGIIRDVLAMGAEPIALLDSLHFGTGAEGRRLLPRVVEGIAFYGNAVGVPTVGGEVGYGPEYETNPLVNVMCVGIRPASRRIGAGARRPGDRVLLVGARTGRDGIGGASLLASRAFAGEGGDDLRPSVQVGDPFLGKLLIEAVLAALATGKVTAVQDCGAAGLTSATAEMARQGGTGIRLDVDRVPRREAGMTPEEVMLSESQERMLLAVAPEDVEAVAAAVRRYGVEATVVGEVTDSGNLEVMAGGAVVGQVPVALLTDGCPTRPAPARRPGPMAHRPWVPTAPFDPEEGLRVLAHPLSRSRADIYTQYDYMVQTRTVAGPGADAAVLALREVPVGLALTVDGPGRWCARDPYAGAARAVVEAVMNLVVSGAEPLGLTDGINCGSPDDPAVFAAFAGLVAGVADAARALGVPVTGGNVSFYNQTGGRAIWPTPVIGAVGRHPRPTRPIRPGWTEAGLVLLRVGAPEGDLGATAWRIAAGDGGLDAARAPDLARAAAVVGVIRDAGRAGWVRAAHDVADGGLFVTLAEMLLAARPGVRSVAVRLAGPARPALFDEGPAQAVLAVAPADVAAVQERARAAGVPCAVLGQTGTGDDGMTVEADDGRFLWPVDALARAYRGDR
ncbi:MAG: phosphoribosylformylglycinamidine synthase subunit PurL [Actinomycetia bacterium]|nr:phosphoribosylformylglycinamidine synthase subunit PurL [Actinomycetes bacterium]